MSTTGRPIIVGPTSVPVFAPAKTASVTLIQTAGTNVAYRIKSIYKITTKEEAAGATHTFTPPPGVTYDAGQCVGYIETPTGRGTFTPTAT